MMSVLLSLFLTLRNSALSGAELQLELPRYVTSSKYLSGRALFGRGFPGPTVYSGCVLSHVWHEWRTALVIVKPETVIAWHRRGFRLLWVWKSRRRMGRPTVPADVRMLIRTMSKANPLWGAPRIHGELLKLGIDVCQTTVTKYMVRRRQPPTQTWRTFLTNHRTQLKAADFFVVPTVTCRLLFVLVMLAHDRRRVVHVAVTTHPTAAWTPNSYARRFRGTRRLDT